MGLLNRFWTQRPKSWSEYLPSNSYLHSIVYAAGPPIEYLYINEIKRGPGLIAAGLGIATMNEHTQDYVERMVRAVPLKRAGTPEDVADVSIFLLSNQARYVTGATIPVAGGLQLA